MNPPPLKTRLLGHPLVSLPVYGLGGFFLYQWTQDSSLWPVALGSMVALSATIHAGEQASAYRNWKRAWDAMGDGPLPTGRRRRVVHFLVGMVMAGALVLFLLSHSDEAEYRLALGWMVLVGGLGLVAMLIARLWRWRAKCPAKAAKTQTVTIAIQRPLFAVPDMGQCYRALPEHCHRLLRAGISDGAR